MNKLTIFKTKLCIVCIFTIGNRDITLLLGGEGGGMSALIFGTRLRDETHPSIHLMKRVGEKNLWPYH